MNSNANGCTYRYRSLRSDSMVHSWTKHTDGTGSTVRVVLFDYRKAFDLIDHKLLVRKLLALDLPVGVSLWIIDFLTARTQRVKLGEDCLSEWRNVPAGVPLSGN